MYSVKWDRFKYSSSQFGIWRICFGSYLAFYYYRIFPYGAELYSREGILPDVASLSQFETVQKILSFDSVEQIKVILVSCIILSSLIAFGFFRKIAAALLCLTVVWLYNRNPFCDSPEYGFINWLIFLCIFIPTGEKYSLGKKDPNWFMPEIFYWGAWLILAIGYCHAGSEKMKSIDSHWRDGSAMYFVLTTDSARMAWYGNFFNRFPIEFFIPLSWGALLSQTLAPFCVLIRSVRPWWWLISTGVHFVLLFFVDLAQVSLGMLVFHLFIFDEKWIEKIKARHYSIQKYFKTGQVFMEYVFQAAKSALKFPLKQ